MQPIRPFLAALILAACALPAAAQTLKTVMVDTNGVMVSPLGAGSSTNLGFKFGATNTGFYSSLGTIYLVRGGSTVWSSAGSSFGLAVPLAFSGTNAATNAAASRGNLGFNSTLNSLWTATNASDARDALLIGDADEPTFLSVTLSEGTNSFIFSADPVNNRQNLGLSLPALTNTSNVTTMRALSGSTNTNEPFSGIIQYADSPTGDTYEMTVSNGIILKTEMQ